MDQTVIDRVVNIATRSALNGCPVKRIVWIPPQSATSSPEGSFSVEYAELLKATENAPWDKD